METIPIEFKNTGVVAAAFWFGVWMGVMSAFGIFGVLGLLLPRHSDRVERLKRLNEGLAERVAAQADLLAQRAEKT